MNKKSNNRKKKDEKDTLYTLWNGTQVKLQIPKRFFPTKEEMEAMDATMPGCQHGWFPSTCEKERLHYRFVLPPSSSDDNIRSILIYMHGIQTHSGKSHIMKDGTKLNFSLLIDYFCNDNNCALYAMDLLGHGFSTGPRMLVSDWKVARNDLTAFCKFVTDKHPGIPFFIIGESFGGCLSLHVAKELSAQQGHDKENKNINGNMKKMFGGVCGLAPAIVSDSLPPAPIIYLLRNVLAPRYPRWIPSFMPNPVKPRLIWTNNREVFRLNHNARKYEMGLDVSGRPMNLGTAVQVLEGSQAVEKDVLPNFSAPFCIIHGEDEKIVSIRGTRLLESLASTPPDNRAVWAIPSKNHDLLACPHHSKAIVEFMNQFINKQIQRIEREQEQQ